jgi:N-acetylmuramoyl-L-alanine amidase
MAKFQKITPDQVRKSKRDIKFIVVHCTATNPSYDFNAKDIEAWHKKLGWSEIGYNYVVLLDGSVEEGRHVDKIPSHVKGYNANSIGIVYVGGVDANQIAKDTRNAKQKTSLVAMLKSLRKLYPTAKILGHRDFPKVAKACPCFNAIPEYSTI